MTTSTPPQRVTEEDIRRLVFTFYGRVQEDEVLGPVFSERLEARWDAHLEKMCDFWSSVLLATGRYLGDPLRAHAQVPGITRAHFDRWIALFEVVAHETLEEWKATDVVGRAVRMRAALERALPQ